MMMMTMMMMMMIFLHCVPGTEVAQALAGRALEGGVQGQKSPVGGHSGDICDSPHWPPCPSLPLGLPFGPGLGSLLKPLCLRLLGWLHWCEEESLEPLPRLLVRRGDVHTSVVLADKEGRQHLRKGLAPKPAFLGLRSRRFPRFKICVPIALFFAFPSFPVATFFLSVGGLPTWVHP